MKKILLCVLLAACGGGSKSAPAPAPLGKTAPAATPAAAPRSDAADAVDKMDEFAGKMCACRNDDCAQGVSDEMVRWSQEMAAANKEPPKMTDADVKRATAIGARMAACMQCAMGGGGSGSNCAKP